MRPRAALILAMAVLAGALAPRAQAVREWYDYYLDARDRLIPAARYDDALAALEQAVRLKPQPALNEQTYGLQFVHYLPYYHMGICHLRRGNYEEAEKLFRREEAAGAIRKSELFRELLRLRGEAQTGVQQRLVRQLREAIAALQREAEEAVRRGRTDEALVKLAEAGSAAQQLNNREIQQAIAERAARLRADQQQREDEAARVRRVEQALADGRRALENGNVAEALVRFDEVRALEPQNAAAAEGQREAQARLLASRDRQALEALLREGKALFEAQRYEEAVLPLTAAAAHPSMGEARELLAKALQFVEGLRREKHNRGRVETLLAEGIDLLGAKRYAEALVRFEAVLEIDPGHPAALERLRRAEELAGLALMSRWLPDDPPSFTLFEPAAADSEVESASIALVGVAYDDKGLAQIAFELGGRTLATLRALPGEAGDPRSWRFDQPFDLQPGLNVIGVVATDLAGHQRRETYRVTRRLRFHETRAFLPSALLTAGGLVAAGWGVQRLRRRRAVRRRFNPYIAGAPVMDEALFFGRDKLLARILNVLHHNSLMITGERRIGKTTFLYHLKKALEADTATDYRFFPVSVDLQGVAEEAFFHALMSDVTDALTIEPGTLQGLRFRPDAPRYDGRDFSHDMQRVIEELKTRTPKQVRLALLIDEVDVLNEYSEITNQRLRSIFMKTFSEHLVAVMSGVGVRRVWKSEGSPWYNFFDEIELQPLTRADAEALIRNPVEGVFRYEPEAVAAILAGSDMKPYIIQKFCIHAVNRMIEHGRSVITRADVEAVRDVARHDFEAAADRRQPAPA
jgi:tetratricopeptide (TPR) repeat protein